jgi:hypothetical protein
MDNTTPKEQPNTRVPSCAPSTNKPDLDALKALLSGQAGLTPADRENMLSMFPEHAERIMAASRKDEVPSGSQHTIV